jgi:hypothetical protein
MPQHGRYYPLSPPRRLVNDMLSFARGLPTVPVERSINVSRAQELRERVPQRLGWCALFLRAYGLVAARFPELRRAYLGFPRARLYEHPYSIASLAIERRYRGEYGVLFGKIRAPENQQLVAIERYISVYKEAPVEQVSVYRRALRVSSFPRPIRRLMWWYALNLSGPGRARRLGTFGLSSYAALGAQSLHPLSPLSTTLNYGPVADDGTVTVRIVYDHRVMDGGAVARALAALEEVFNGELIQEMEQLCSAGSLSAQRKAG